MMSTILQMFMRIILIFDICICSTRISNEVGAGNPNKARFVVRVALLITIIEAVTVSTTIFVLRYILGYAFSDEKEVINYVTEMAPLICISIIIDSLHGVLSGYLLNLVVDKNYLLMKLKF